MERTVLDLCSFVLERLILKIVEHALATDLPVVWYSGSTLYGKYAACAQSVGTPLYQRVLRVRSAVRRGRAGRARGGHRGRAHNRQTKHDHVAMMMLD